MDGQSEAQPALIEEKRGEFYLGKAFDPEQGVLDAPLRYDAKDLTTHGVCVGMTGSGKTGLCLSLLEEAALDGVPALCIDPKGDLGNLLLTFPDLAPASFEPWIDAADAERNEQTTAERAAFFANLWKNGLAKWGQNGDRIQRFRDAVDLTIYTPGSSAGLPLSVLKGLNAPASHIDDEVLRERVLATVSGILALVGIAADPVQSREHVFLSNIVHRAWSAGEDLAIGELIRAILEPPFSQIGVLDVESFYPSKDRQALAMKLNSLLASPSFAGWLEGEALDVQKLLYTAEGKPRVTILSIAHLSDAERMFFVTLLLGEVVAWMRSQAGTTGLRALLYMDEVMGFLPPVAEPPSKKPLMTLLKQARAFGVGCLLATQNPVDVDYKALSNCGTWFLGRLQTGRDVDRVIDGLSGAAQIAGKQFDPATTRATLAGLKSRVFLMNNVHEGAPTLFHTRWALSYLRGPLTRTQISTLMADKRAAAQTQVERAEAQAKTNQTEQAEQETQTAEATETDATENKPGARKTPGATMVDPHIGPAMAAVAAGTGTAAAATTAATRTPAANAQASSGSKTAPVQEAHSAHSHALARPILPDHIEEICLPSATGLTEYVPALMAWTDLHYSRASAGLDHWYHPVFLAPLVDGPPSELWKNARVLSADTAVIDPPDEGTFGAIPRGALGKARLRSAGASLKAHCYAEQPVILGKCTPLKLWSRIDEDRQEFGERYEEAHQQDLIARLEKVHARHAKKVEKAEGKVEKAKEKLAREEAQHEQHKLDTGLSIGTAVLGAVFGRGSVSGHARRAASSAKRAKRAGKEKEDVARATEALAAAEEDLKAAQDAGNAALEAEKTKAPPPIEEVRIAPKKSDIQVTRIALAWVPKDRV